MELSSRNQLKATVREVKLGNIMAEVVMDLAGGQQVVAQSLAAAWSTWG